MVQIKNKNWTLGYFVTSKRPCYINGNRYATLPLESFGKIDTCWQCGKQAHRGIRMGEDMLCIGITKCIDCLTPWEKQLNNLLEQWRNSMINKVPHYNEELEVLND